ncbi:MAG: EAL domain-containing protein [Anaerolineales bacterium]|nr:EAL domain-containing protein [Anaerolineales bacterium]
MKSPSLRNFLLSVLGKLIEPHPSIKDQRKRLEAKMVSFMVLVMIVGIVLNYIFSKGLTIYTLIGIGLGYIISRTKYYQISIYLLIGGLLASTIYSILVGREFDSHTIFIHVAWLSLSLVFASILLTVRKSIFVAIIHLVAIFSLAYFVPDIDLRAIGVSIGFLLVFSSLLITTMQLRNLLEETRQEEISIQATHDQLTGLPNRILFHDRLEQALARAERRKTIFSVLYLDLDNFKYVNDEYSHDDGDRTLRIIAERIKKCIRNSDTAGRISGDEFLVLLENIENSENAAAISQKILDAISRPITSNGPEIMITASIGITIFPEDGKTNVELMQNADIAMYYAKSEGKNSFSFFRPEMKSEILKNIALSKNLQTAHDNNEFYLEYQPQYDIRTEKVFGAEALIRWRHPQQGLIKPREFISVAENNGMIIPIGEWVIKDVLSLQNNFENSSRQRVRISVNVSGRQIKDPHFIKKLDEIITTSKINPNCLELEITEGTIFENYDQTVSVLKEIRSLGIRLAIDNFGTGYSSLSHLESLPFDTLKIDSSFIHRISNPKVSPPILTGIISIAADLGLEVIAEGVENRTQLEFLRASGCYLVQGYLLKPSLDQNKFINLLAKQHIE